MCAAPLRRVRPGEPVRADLINAILDRLDEQEIAVPRDSGLQLTAGTGRGRLLRLRAGRGRAGSAAADVHPFQPYQPAGATAFQIATRPGLFNLLRAENEALVITVPASQTGGYFVWAECDLDPDSGLLTAWRQAHGATLPMNEAPDDTTGQVPTPVYELLYAVTSDASKVLLDPAREYATANKKLLVRVTDIADNKKTRLAYFLPAAPDAFYGNYDAGTFLPVE